MSQLKPANRYESRIWTNNIRLACWVGAWVGTCALMTLGPKFVWNRALPLTLLAVGLNVCVGIGVILAHKSYIAQLDELQRKVYLNALAITVGVALIAGAPFSVMDKYHVIPFKADIAHLTILMALTFFVSLVYGSVRYR
jgi:hypothetical protein